MKIIFLGLLIMGAAVFRAEAAQIEISLNPLMELNGTTRDEVIDLRRQLLGEVPAFAPKEYRPDMNIWRSLKDGKPWWGFLGICYYGPGEKSILGNSKESRFIANPYLLVGVEEPHAMIVEDPSLSPEEYYPKITQLIWEANAAWGLARYDVSGFSAKAGEYHSPDPRHLYLSDYNARDFGFNFLAIDAKKSQNIEAAFGEVIPVIQFIHTGTSCGYPGGCNNKSPSQGGLNVTWVRLPARIYVKLWKEKPSDAQQDSDMNFLIDLN